MKKQIIKITIGLMLYTSPTYADEKVILFLGDTKNIPITSGSVWVEHKEIINVQGLGSTIKVSCKKEGQSLITFNKKTNVISCLHPNKKMTFDTLNLILQKTIGLNLEIRDNQIHIVGKLFRFEDWKHIASKLKNDHFDYIFSAEMSPEINSTAVSFFKEQIKKEGLSPVALNFNEYFMLRLNPNDAQFANYERLLKPFGVSIEKYSSSIETAPIVKVQISIAEVKRGEAQKLGLRWPEMYSASLVEGGLLNSNSILVNAAAFEQTGLGRILASPNIICKSGKEAEFFAGGEFPIKIINYKSQNVTWKQYGIILKVKPLADSSGKISLSINTEISTIDDSKKVDDVPAINTNKVSSYFDLTSPKTIALSGLLKNEDGSSKTGLPFLSRIPIFSKLFSSDDYRNNKTELVIFVRPEILSEDDLEKSNLQHFSAGENLYGK